VDWIDQTGGIATAFDFTTKGILQEACGKHEFWRLVDKKGRAPGVIGLWPGRAVTFIDNHDTGSTQSHWPFPSNKVGMGYAYILTHPGTPTVFWDHYFDWGDDLKKQISSLLRARDDAGIHSRSKLDIVAATDSLYAAHVGDRLAVKLGGDWSPSGGGWEAVASGDGWCVWTKQ
jgi:alpha-amylase